MIFEPTKVTNAELRKNKHLIFILAMQSLPLSVINFVHLWEKSLPSQTKKAGLEKPPQASIWQHL
jgi:hypothetical protein